MVECGICGKWVGGIWDHIRAKHGFPYYCEAPDSKYYGKNDPPHEQADCLPDALKEP